MLPFNCETEFSTLFRPAALNAAFEERFQFSSVKGTDRLNGSQYIARAPLAFDVASQKCLSGTFRFSPYAEDLRLKDRWKPPRLISVPTIRDRVILNQLKALLSRAFPECVPKNTASATMRSITQYLETLDPTATTVCGCDIRDFYPSLDHARLLKLLSSKITDARALTLLRRSISTPTVPLNARRSEHARYACKKGIPQGLAVSNILAGIYLRDVDSAMIDMPVFYTRYVDDVIIIGSDSAVRKAHRSFVARVRARRLSVHSLNSGKTHITPMQKPFTYLGYAFHWPQISVRRATLERLLQSLAARFSDYRHNTNWRLRRYTYLTPERCREIFIEELNERITGAISEGRRYGWIAYFNQIKDLSLLHRLDASVNGFFQRLPDFDRHAPTGLKTFSRSFFEMKYRPLGGYVRNFDALVTPTQQLLFLVERGRVAPEEGLTNQQIMVRFQRYQKRILGAMQADEDMIY